MAAWSERWIGRRRRKRMDDENLDVDPRKLVLPSLSKRRWRVWSWKRRRDEIVEPP